MRNSNTLLCSAIYHSYFEWYDRAKWKSAAGATKLVIHIHKQSNILSLSPSCALYLCSIWLAYDVTWYDITHSMRKTHTTIDTAALQYLLHFLTASNAQEQNLEKCSFLWTVNIEHAYWLFTCGYWNIWKATAIASVCEWERLIRCKVKSELKQVKKQLFWLKHKENKNQMLTNWLKMGKTNAILRRVIQMLPSNHALDQENEHKISLIIGFSVIISNKAP